MLFVPLKNLNFYIYFWNLLLPEGLATARLECVRGPRDSCVKNRDFCIIRLI